MLGSEYSKETVSDCVAVVEKGGFKLNFKSSYVFI